MTNVPFFKKTYACEYWRNKINLSQCGTRQCHFFKRTKILGTACEFGLSLISLALSECMSHLGLNTNINNTRDRKLFDFIKFVGIFDRVRSVHLENNQAGYYLIPLYNSRQKVVTCFFVLFKGNVWVPIASHSNA